MAPLLAATGSSIGEQVTVAILNGLVVGASIALVAAGLALIFGVLEILNLAQGDFYMLGGYVLWLSLSNGLNFWLGAALAALVVGIGGGLLLMAMLRPLRNRPGGLILLATLGLSLILQQLATNIFGGDTKPIHTPITAQLTVGTKEYPVYDLLIVVVAAVILLGGYLFLRYAKYGIWLRAVAQNHEMASVLGVPVSRVYLLALIISSALAGVAGSLLVPLSGIYPTVGLDITVNSFIVVIAGGLGNFRGAAVIALLLGVVESVGSIWIRAQAVQLLVFAVVIAVLIVRSQRQSALVRL
jgi:branched-chain amino acid transport system permease protein